jgi:germination protein M
MPKKVLCVLLVLSLLLCCQGCGLFQKKSAEEGDTLSSENYQTEETEENIRKTVMYYANEYDMLVPIVKDILWVEGIGKAAIECLVDGPETRMSLAEMGLKPTLPEGTRILGMSIRDGLAKVDLSSDFLYLSDEVAEKNAISSVVYTLTEFPTIDRVSILVDGKPLSMCPHGTVVDEVLERENINLEKVDSELSVEEAIPVTLYFKGSNLIGSHSYYVPVTRLVKKSDDMIFAAIQELIKGPEENTGLSSAIPPETQVLDVRQEGPEVIVNLSKEVEGYGGGIDSEQALVNSIVLTATQFSGVEKVSLLVEGETGVLPEGTVLDSPILKPVYVNSDSL